MTESGRPGKQILNTFDRLKLLSNFLILLNSLYSIGHVAHIESYMYVASLKNNA
jgi:hypothetical protein